MILYTERDGRHGKLYNPLTLAGRTCKTNLRLMVKERMLTRTKYIWLPLAAWSLLGLCAAGCNYLKTSLSDAEYKKGQNLFDQGKLDEALLAFDSAVRRDPNLVVAHQAMGDIYLRKGDPEAAKNSYESACTLDPYSFRNHYNLGVTYQLLAEAAKTVETLQKNLAEAVRVYLRAVTIDPADYDTNLNLSACYFQLGRYNLAEQYCQAALKLKETPQAYSNLGIIYDSQDKRPEAIKAYKESLELDVHQPVILMNLGCSYVRQGRVKTAIRIFEMVVKESPADSAPWEQLGACWFHLRDLDQSMECYQKAAEINPKSPDAHRGLGVVYMTIALTDPEKVQLRQKAVAEWQTSLDLRPDQKDLASLLEKYGPKSQASAPSGTLLPAMQ